MPTIRLDDEVFAGLQKLAKPFVDTPSSVIRRLLEDKGVLVPAKPEARESPTPRSEKELALTPQSTYEKYLLSTLEAAFNGRAHKRDVTQAVIERMQADGLIGAADLEMVATGETKAENTIAWGRNALKDRGYISKISPRGIWELTPEGHTAALRVELVRSKK